MIYSGTFESVNNTRYRVDIITEGSQRQELTLSGSPFVTEMDQSGDVIYTPAKYQTATVGFITPDYNLDIYSPAAQGTKVELYQVGNSDTLMWTGYVTPNLYDQGFSKHIEEVQVECIDALSTLQYFKYNTEEKSTVSLWYIINKLIKQCNAYSKFYISDNTQLTATGNSCIAKQLYISESNFFDEKEDGETDQDVAWTCQEVLEEICRYLGLTAIADKDSVYFVDYDAIKAGINTYWRYTVDNETGVKVTKSFSKAITGSDFSATGSTLSLDNVYNKVNVVSDYNTFEEVIPSVFDNMENITADTDPDLASSTNINNGMYGEVISGNDGNMIIMVDRVYDPDDGHYTDYNAVAVKYFNNPNYKFYKYNSSGQDITNSVTSLNYTDTKTMKGATIAQFFVKELDHISGTSDLIMQWLSQHLTLDAWLAMNEISNLSFTNYIMMLNPKTDHISNENAENYPYFETVVSDTNALFGGQNAYLLIKGSYIFHYFFMDPYPIPDGEVNIDPPNYKIEASTAYLLAKLQWGDLYWNGDEWVSTSTTFKIPFVKPTANKEDRRADALMFKDNKFVNTVSWRIGTNETGQIIPMPDSTVAINGLPKLTVYKPIDPTWNGHGQYYKMNCVFLKDFAIKAIVGDPTFSKANDTDTNYSMVIDEDYIQELGDIKMKVATHDNKNPNFSCVAYMDNGEYKFLDKTYNKALASEVTGLVFNGINGDEVCDGLLRQEWWLVYRIYKQYSSASIKLNFSLRNDNEIWGLYSDGAIDEQQSDKYFIADSINKDYRLNTQNITLIEKK